MGLKEKMITSFQKNPIAWILGALLVVSVHGNYKTGKAFTESCQLMMFLTDDFSAYPMLFAKSEYDLMEINKKNSDATIEKVDMLLKARTRLGDAFRSNYFHWKELRKVCEERVSENRDYES
jgi:hypothetical protein